MRKRYKIRRKIKFKKINIILVILFLLGICIYYVFKWFNYKAKPLFLEYAESETRKLATLVINNAVSKQLTEDLTVDNLFDIKYDSNNNISSINFNSVVINKTLTTTTSNVELNLKYLQEGKLDLLSLPDDIKIEYESDKLDEQIVYEIPSGIIFDNGILVNVFPKIPVKLNLIGSIVSSIRTNVEDYGINNALIEVYLDLKVEIKVILPFTSEVVEVKTSIPVALKLIQGNVPSYYLNGYLKTPYNENVIS